MYFVSQYVARSCGFTCSERLYVRNVEAFEVMWHLEELREVPFPLEAQDPAGLMTGLLQSLFIFWHPARNIPAEAASSILVCLTFISEWTAFEGQSVRLVSVFLHQQAYLPLVLIVVGNDFEDTC